MKVVIVGAGHAGGSAAALLKASAFEGEIVLLGEESAPPYQRPPLSKAWLKGEADVDSLLLRPAVYYAEQGITLRTGVVVTEVAPAERTVTLSDGGIETYDALILATGSTSRRLPILGADRPELIELRTLADAERLKGQLGPGRRLVIVGGGYVGLEAAASARSLGAEVVLLERLDRVLKRVASEPLSAFFTDRHRAENVDIRLNVEVAGFDACIDYKSEDLRAALKREAPEGIDIYFDNVGGDTLLAVCEQLALNARLVLCGLIAQYNGAAPVPLNPGLLIRARATLRGLVVYDHWSRLPEMQAEIGAHIRTGALRYREEIHRGLASTPAAFARLMAGHNQGKALVLL